MTSNKEHSIFIKSTIKSALKKLDSLASDAVLFVVDKNKKLIGSLTDGDIRRGLIKGISMEESIEKLYNSKPKFVTINNVDIKKIIDFKSKKIKIIPLVDNDKKVIEIINLNNLRSFLPVDAVIMAGGEGKRLRPLTETKPKPLLMVGEKPIMEHNVDRLAEYGISNFWFSINYLGDQIEKYFNKAGKRNMKINYVWEGKPLGTIGSISLIDNFTHEHILISNSDILTTIDYEAFYLDFLEKDADFSVLTIPYNVTLPYGILETKDSKIVSFKEKPTYNYFSNGGIYLMKRKLLEYIPKNTFFNATDLMEELISLDKKIVSYPASGYWLDIGKPEDFSKAQIDINRIN